MRPTRGIALAGAVIGPAGAVETYFNRGKFLVVTTNVTGVAHDHRFTLISVPMSVSG